MSSFQYNQNVNMTRNEPIEYTLHKHYYDKDDLTNGTTNLTLNELTVDDTSSSTSINTGAIVTAGGIGCAKDLFIGGTLNGIIIPQNKSGKTLACTDDITAATGGTTVVPANMVTTDTAQIITKTKTIKRVQNNVDTLQI